MAVSHHETRRIARLLRIDVPEERINPLSRELTAILDWIEQLNEVDIESVEPMVTPVDFAMPRRSDTARTPQSDPLANAPDARDGFFVVPKIIE